MHLCLNVYSYSCRDRLGPAASEQQKREKIAKVEDNIVNNLNFTPGGHAKKWDPAGVDFARFLERQQAFCAVAQFLPPDSTGDMLPCPSRSPCRRAAAMGEEMMVTTTKD